MSLFARQVSGGETGHLLSHGGLDYATFDDKSDLSAEEEAPEASALAALQPQDRGLIAAHFATCFFFGGVIFGWGPLQLLLEDDHVYRNMCPGGVPKCKEQEQELVLLYTIGVAAGTFAVLPLGVLVDKTGPRVSGAVSGLMLALGFFLLGYSENGGLEAFRVSIILIVIGGHLVQSNSFPLSFIVPVPVIPFVMTGINCFFDASTTINWFLQQTYLHAGVGRRSIFVGYAAFCLAVHAVLVALWGGRPIARLQAAKESAAPPAEASGQERAAASAPPLHGLPVQAQLRTFEFTFALLFSCIQMFRSNLYLGVNKELLERLGDARTGYFYIGAFSLLLPSALACIPLISWFMRRYGYAGTFLAMIVVGAIWNVVVLMPSLQLQLVAFVAFSIFRAILFSVIFAFIAQTFGPCTSATVQGVIFVAVAGVNLLIWPSMVLVNSRQDGDFTLLFAATLALLVPLAVMLPELSRRLESVPAADCRDPSLGPADGPPQKGK